MKIEKLPSGSYRIRKMYKGKMHTVVFDSKPTQKEAMMAMAKELEKVQGDKCKPMDFREAAEEYIESKRNVLSPSTIVGYRNILSRLSDKILAENIHDIEPVDVQREINRLAKSHSPKTVRNYHGFISAVLGMFNPNLKLNTTLPQKVREEPYIPSDEDVRKILECSKGTKFEIPIILACYGMRRSEICALAAGDVEGDMVHINKALVQNEDGEWVVKSTKTTASTRDIIIPEEIAKEIREKGYVYKGNPCSITQFLGDVQDRMGMPRFSVHKLRHYFASKMSAMNVPEADILKMGGWESDHVMKSVYRHSMMEKEENAKRDAANQLKDALFP